MTITKLDPLSAVAIRGTANARFQNGVGAGEWYVEYLPFLAASQVQAAQTAVGCPALPSGTDMEQELFRGVHRQHTKVDAVQGMHLVTVDCLLLRRRT